VSCKADVASGCVTQAGAAGVGLREKTAKTVTLDNVERELDVVLWRGDRDLDPQVLDRRQALFVLSGQVWRETGVRSEDELHAWSVCPRRGTLANCPPLPLVVGVDGPRQQHLELLAGCELGERTIGDFIEAMTSPPSPVSIRERSGVLTHELSVTAGKA
jgi:hypothetical protein